MTEERATAMTATICSAGVVGVEGKFVHLTAEIRAGAPIITIGNGSPGAAQETRERVASALRETDIELPPRNISVDFAGAPSRLAAAPGHDLPIALAILAAHGVVPRDAIEDICIVGELGLAGDIRPVRGALPIAEAAHAAGIQQIVVPSANASEAALVSGLKVYGARTLADVIGHLTGLVALPLQGQTSITLPHADDVSLDMADITGHAVAKRALEVAAAGGHHLLLVAAPGAGASMLCRRLTTILPPMEAAEVLRVTRLHSVAGRLAPDQGALTMRPFRAPHHSISDSGLLGGGSLPRPGEVSLADGGVLYLDEIHEFRGHVLEGLRDVLGRGSALQHRHGTSVAFPARPLLVAAMGPCPCGFRGDVRGYCRCTEQQAERHVRRTMQRLGAVFQMHIGVQPEASVSGPGRAEPSAAIQRRVALARRRQAARFAGANATRTNAEMTAAEITEHCVLGADGAALLSSATKRLSFSSDTIHAILRVARTIADLEDEAAIAPSHVAEAIQYQFAALPARAQTPAG